MPKKNPYNSFENFVLRTPLLSFNFYKKLTSEQNIADDEFKRIFTRLDIREALFLASPILFIELEKWLDNKIVDPKKIDKLKSSLLKYISRMSSRCTPFGLFAGCAVGYIENETKITLDDSLANSRHTRLDMNYLVALSQNLAKEENIKHQILFYPNTSIYKSGKQFRYVEFEYIGSSRLHHVIGVDYSVYLKKVLEATKNGLLFKDIVDLLIDEENSIEIVTEFIDELIDSQILVNELEPSVSGPEFLDQITSVLSRIKNTEIQQEILKNVSRKLLTIDKVIGNKTDCYIDISVELEKLNTDFDMKYLFQTDLKLKPKLNTIDVSVVESVKRALSLFNKITIPQKETLLKNFKEAFYERFEEREVPITLALDVESGIGYKQNSKALDINPLIDDVVLSLKEVSNSNKEVKWSKFNSIFNKKLIESFLNNDYIIVLSDSDFIGFEENWNDLPDTLSAMIELVSVNKIEKVLIKSAGGSSGANMLGRFCHGDYKLNKHTMNIVNFEKENNKNKILAEIVHLPESRVGNVLMRPVFRDFEIPYLAKSVLNNDKQIKIDDLFISIKKQNIYMRSKSLNKEVIPKLTTAHNYTSNSLPIYHFLSEMQSQNKRSGIGFQLGPFVDEYDFIPRVEYNDLILSEAFWNIRNNEIEVFLKIIDQESELLDKMRDFRINKKIPQFILLIENDNELLVNLQNINSIKMLLSCVKNKISFKIKEFLHTENGVVKNSNNEYFTNQIILSFYNSKKVRNE